MLVMARGLAGNSGSWGVWSNNQWSTPYTVIKPHMPLRRESLGAGLERNGGPGALAKPWVAERCGAPCACVCVCASGERERETE